MRNDAAIKASLMLEDLKRKLHLFDNYLIWKVLKQIEFFCTNNEVEVPKEVEFSIKILELAAKQQGAFLDKWDDGMDYVSWRKSTNVADGNCMFFEQDKFLRKKLECNKKKIKKINCELSIDNSQLSMFLISE